MISFKLLILVLGVIGIFYVSKIKATMPEPESDIEDEQVPKKETEDVQEPEERTDKETDKETDTESEPLPEPQPQVEPDRDCNIYYRNYKWALQDCVCRPFQNECLMKIENTERINDGNTPFVPVTEELCQSFIPQKCSRGRPVVAQFPIPAPCGCNRKPGSIATERFPSLCHLLKFSAENKKPFLSYSYS